MIKRLRTKFVLINMLIVTVILLAIMTVLLQSTQNNWERYSFRMLNKAASGEHFEFGRQNDQVRLPYFTVHLNSWGDIIAVGGNSSNLSDDEYLENITQQALKSKQDVGQLKRNHLRFMRNVSSMGTLIAFVDTTSEEANMLALARTCFMIILACLLVFLAISILLARWAVQPVDHAWRQQKQFVADASHELKTPLTVILTNAELLQTQDYDEAARRQCANSIRTMASQMRGLVEGLLELARVDNGVVKNSFAPLDLSQVVNDAVLPFEPLLFEKEMTLESNIAEHIHVRGSEAHLRQLVEIFLDNAMKYGDPQSTVYVGLQMKGSHCQLIVSNEGSAISHDDLKNIFKRFYRIDSARSMNHSYGLGLSIAEGIVQDHRGKIWAESEHGVNTFYV